MDKIGLQSKVSELWNELCKAEDTCSEIRQRWAAANIELTRQSVYDRIKAEIEAVIAKEANGE